MSKEQQCKAHITWNAALGFGDPREAPEDSLNPKTLTQDPKPYTPKS